MNAKPLLLAWLICDGVHVDPATGKHTLLGIFSNIRVRQFPARHPRMIWFLVLTEVAVGEHRLRINLGHDYSDGQPVAERPFRSESPTHKINLINEMRNMTFDRPGDYIITVEIDEDPVLVTNLGVSG